MLSPITSGRKSGLAPLRNTKKREIILLCRHVECARDSIIEKGTWSNAPTLGPNPPETGLSCPQDDLTPASLLYTIPHPSPAAHQPQTRQPTQRTHKITSAARSPVNLSLRNRVCLRTETTSEALRDPPPVSSGSAKEWLPGNSNTLPLACPSVWALWGLPVSGGGVGPVV